MNQSIKSRIAPTPSGYLHVGNAYNFLVTYRETVIKREGKLHLRIDDSDSTRMRDEYLQDIFETMDWLQIPFDGGPKDPQDFKQNFSQSLKKMRYLEFLESIPNTYACECSRSFLKENHCPCKESELNHTPGKTAVKVTVDDLALKENLGDFILWRKDDLPAYQLASLYDDISENMNLIVRGEDLLSSTKAQFFLAESIGDKVFTHASFLHHPTIKGENGEKISKSQGDSMDSGLCLKHWRSLGKTRDDLLKYFGFESFEDFLNS